ncbi:MAG TPA: aminotransferase class IV [Planctomycetota bacterium]|nr:aminotransferase class IV [Planctomycetota bacterium]
MGEIAYLNGTWMAPAEARVPAEDRGYLFGDGLYEVVVSYGGRPWALERHLARLERGVRELRFEGVRIDEVRDVAVEGLRRCEIADAFLYLQVTRGVAPRKHNWPADMTPTLFATVRPQPVYDPKIWVEGVAMITTPEIRWGRCDIKSTNLLPNCLARQKAVEAGATDAIFVRDDGIVTECAMDSLFIVTGGTVVTREDGPHILPGITQGLVVETAGRLGIPVDRRPFTKTELFAADEVFLTGTTPMVLGIRTIDGVEVGGGVPGEITKKLLAAYIERRDRGDDAPQS